MNFFKKIFGSLRNHDESKPTPQDNRLELYKKMPGMTDLRLDNISTCLQAGFIPATSLPISWEREIRPKLEIAKRLNAIKAIVLWLMVPSSDLPDEKILHFVSNNELENYLTDKEKMVLEASRDDEQLRQAIGWKFENSWPLAWYFGYEKPEITGHMMTGKQMQQIILQHTCPLDDKIEDWVHDKQSVSETELIKTEDLFYCLHNAVRSAQLGKPTIPTTFDPIGNGGVIHERRHALSWMLSSGVDWDDTDLST